MRNKKLQIFLMLIGVLLFDGLLCAQSPGTASDPLVSKSYLDQFFRFRSVVVPLNFDIKPSAGALIIVRSGSIRLEGPKGKAIVDLTTGKEIPVGNDLPINHLLIIPDSADYVLKAKKLSLLLATYLLEEKH
ncbi:MAG: hypothetical protein Kow0029_31120 [Candidatus Rifleibacteriota bacterium]